MKYNTLFHYIQLINNNYITKENVIELELIGEGSAFAKPDSATIIAKIEYSDTIKDTSMQSAIQIFNSIKDILYKNCRWL